jgi:hypothetical protein
MLYFAAGLMSLLIGFFAYDFAGQIPKHRFLIIRYDIGLYPDTPFSAGAIRNPSLLLEHIARDKSALSQKIYSTLSGRTKELANKSDLSKDEFEELKLLLLYELNTLLGTNDILDKTLYEGLDLPSDLTLQIGNSSTLRLNERIRLSRLLLYAAYPDAISNRQLTRWDYWSLAALALTFMFSFLFDWDCYHDTGRPAIFDHSIGIRIQYRIKLLYWVGMASIMAAAAAVVFHAAVVKLISIAFFFLAWCIIDNLIARHHPTNIIKEQFNSLFWYIDFPFLVGLSVLFVFYIYLNPLSFSELEPDADAFFAGAIAFKVILQNTNFLVVILRSMEPSVPRKDGG